MDEAGAYEALRPRLQALGLDPHRVENVLAGGTPDVWYSVGAIEMKYLAAWPRRPETPVLIPTLIERKQQVPWLWRRWRAGGPAWVMLRVDRQYLLFAGPDARAVRLGRTRAELLTLACWRTNAHGEGDWAQLRAWLLWTWGDLPTPQRAKLLRLICNHTVAQAAAILGIGVCAVERGESEECQTTSDLIEAWTV